MKKKMINKISKTCRFLQMQDRPRLDLIQAKLLEPLAKNLRLSHLKSTLIIIEKIKEAQTFMTKMINQRFLSPHRKIMHYILLKEELKIKTDQYLRMTTT